MPDDLIADLEAALKPIARAGAARGPIEPRSVPSTLIDLVADVVHQRIAPFIIARGGQLRVKSIEDGVVTLEASGSPGAIVPAIERIEPLVRAAVPQISAVHVVAEWLALTAEWSNAFDVVIRSEAAHVMRVRERWRVRVPREVLTR
jgi:Fe-S cluster biogenesis protein NfuA